MTFKPSELYKPYKYDTAFDQQHVYKTPINIVTDTLYLEGVDCVLFNYDADKQEDEGVEIEWCEICITFAAGGEMYIKTTDSNILDACGFDWSNAWESANELLEGEGSMKSEHCTLWGLK